MILNHTHKYKKGFFNNKNNCVPKKIMALGLSVSIFAGALTNLVLNINNFSIDHPIDTDNYYIKQAIVDQLHTEDYYFNNNDLIYSNNNNVHNYQVTIEDLAQIKQLRITPEDTDILKYCKNLETLQIDNCNFITQDTIMISYINALKNLKEITFSFEDMDFFLENPEYKIDLDQFENDININFYLTHENNQLLLLSTLKESNLTNERINHDKLSFITQDKTIALKEYTDVNNKLNDIVNSFSITSTDEEKVATLLQTTINLIDYDPYIQDNIYALLLNDEQYAEDYDKLRKLESFYNKYPISSILKENTGFGICVNYTNIFTILAYKCGIESYNVSLNNIAHIINLIRINDTYQLIDITEMDNNSACQTLLNKYQKTKNKTYLLEAIEWSTGSGLYDKFDDTDEKYTTKINNEEKDQSSTFETLHTLDKVNSHMRINYTGTSFLETLPFALTIGFAFSKYLEKILQKEIKINTYHTQKYPTKPTLKKRKR